jgi:hypothetical protein
MPRVRPDHQVAAREQPGHLLQPFAGHQHVLGPPEDGGGGAKAWQLGLHVPSMQRLQEPHHRVGRHPRRIRQQRLGHGRLERSGRHHLAERLSQHEAVGSQRAVHPVAGSEHGHRGAVVGIHRPQEAGGGRASLAHLRQSRRRRRGGKEQAVHARPVMEGVLERDGAAQGMPDQMERIQAEPVHQSGQVVRKRGDAVGGLALVRCAARGVAAPAEIHRYGPRAGRKPFQDGLPPAPRGEVAVDQDVDLRSRPGFFIVDSQPGGIEEWHRFVRCSITQCGVASNLSSRSPRSSGPSAQPLVAFDTSPAVTLVWRATSPLRAPLARIEPCSSPSPRRCRP